MPYVTIAGNRMFYAVHREEGPAVVLIPGAGENHLLWPSALRRLPNATVYAIDLPGHGRSETWGQEFIEDYAADVVKFVDAVGVERAVLMGHSMGGAVAQMIALTAPERVAGLVLLATGARLRVAPLILEGLQKDFEATILQIGAWAWGPDADQRQVALSRQAAIETGPYVMLGDFVACERFDVRERLGEIRVPTLVMTGSEDRMTPPKLGQYLAEQIPGARFILVPGAGHMLMLEKPRRVAKAVREFLNELPAASPRQAL